jgi:lysophospholipase L1-like esterase
MSPETPQPPEAADPAPRTKRRRRKLPLRKKISFSVIAFLLAFGMSECTLTVAAKVAYFTQVTRYNPPVRAKSDDVFRIVTLGDSVTAGQGTAPRYSYPRQLGSILDEVNGPGKFEVINQGVYALNSSRLVDLLPGWLEQHQPDLIVVMTGCNNPWNYTNSHLEELDLLKRTWWQIELNRTRTYRFLRVALRRAQVGFGIAEEQMGDTTPPLEGMMRISESISPPVDGTARTLERQRTIFKNKQALEDLLLYDLERIKDLSRAAGAELVVMTYPFTPPHHDHRGVTRAFGQKYKLITVDNYGTFQRMKNDLSGLDLFSADRGHPNATGYRIIANGVYRGLFEQQERLGIELGPPIDPLAEFKDLDYLAQLRDEVRAATEDPSTDEYRWEALGYVAAELTDWDTAEEAFRTAFKLSNGAPQFYESLGTMYASNGDWDKLQALVDEMKELRGDRNDIGFLMSMFERALATRDRGEQAPDEQDGDVRRRELGTPQAPDDGPAPTPEPGAAPAARPTPTPSALPSPLPSATPSRFKPIGGKGSPSGAPP